MSTQTAPGGNLRAVCEVAGCGNVSPPAPVSHRGEIDVWDLPLGWSCAPYAKHDDRYVCADCNAARGRDC